MSDRPDTLEALGEELTEIMQALDELPSAELEALREGPFEEPHCRICSVLTWDGFHAKSDAAELIVDWHNCGMGVKLAAMTGTLGTTRRAEVAEVTAARERYEASQPYAIARRGIDSLAESLSFMRCLFIYQAAGWKP